MSEVLFTWHNANDSIAELEYGLQLAQASNAKSLLILACNDNNFTEQQINPLITRCNLPIFGGIYPKLIFKKQLMQQGCIIIGFKEAFEVSLITQLSTLATDEKLEQAIEAMLLNQSRLTINDNFLIFYDALSYNIEPFIDCLFGCLEHHINIIGGGAGSLDFIQKACVFTNEGLLTDVIQLVSLQSKLVIGATHGWETLQGPFLVSEAQKQTVKSLNYSPAFHTYKEAIENASHHKINDDNFFDIAKHFPLGIEDINNQLVVRDPILTHDGYIQCVGNVPVNSMVYLLKGSLDSLLAAAKQAAISATNDIDDKGFSATMVFDCISRVLYMEDSFSQELDLIAEQCFEQSLFGVLSLGEIANNRSGAIKLLNKSTVVGSW
jgi:hypothetical protein